MMGGYKQFAIKKHLEDFMIKVIKVSWVENDLRIVGSHL
jgi:hypothetical protein